MAPAWARSLEISTARSCSVPTMIGSSTVRPSISNLATPACVVPGKGLAAAVRSVVTLIGSASSCAVWRRRAASLKHNGSSEKKITGSQSIPRESGPQTCIAVRPLRIVLRPPTASETGGLGCRCGQSRNRDQFQGRRHWGHCRRLSRQACDPSALQGRHPSLACGVPASRLL